MKLDPTPETPQVFTDVIDERIRQVIKWGAQSLPDGTSSDTWGDMAMEAKQTVDERAAAGTLTWVEVLDEEILEAYAETDPARLRAELIQVAAVAIAWAEDIDRRSAAA